MAKCTLLTLPLEIREKIWKYVCDDSVITLSWQDKLVGENNRCAIPFVCRQIYIETVSLLEPIERFY